jgi:hypothetical protein
MISIGDTPCLWSVHGLEHELDKCPFLHAIDPGRKLCQFEAWNKQCPFPLCPFEHQRKRCVADDNGTNDDADLGDLGDTDEVYCDDGLYIM